MLHIYEKKNIYFTMQFCGTFKTLIIFFISFKMMLLFKKLPWSNREYVSLSDSSVQTLGQTSQTKRHMFKYFLDEFNSADF